ncbi:hypothetical protein [Actinomadura oligospora]|uniref:hypothetical protein n=1 Tax=Actinomadura oligospora TaxID=111804 RepID=UPI00047D5560|nr:hypothetical protein [Actinomadura oligospora]
MNDDTLIRRLNPMTDEEVARMVSPRTKAELGEGIMATATDATPDAAPARSRPRRKRMVLFGGLPLAVATAGAVALTIATAGTPGTHRTPGAAGTSGSPAGSPTYNPAKAQPAALTFRTEGKDLVVRIKDPLADPARFRREFAAHGMKITLRLVPVSPSLVGGIVMSELPSDVGIISAKGRCDNGGGACPVGLRIPTGFRGSGAVTFGRAARPGEQYTSSKSAFAAGEALHCVPVRGLTVDQALPVLRRHNVQAGQWHYDEKRAGGEDFGVTTADRSKIPGNWIVTDADPWAPGQVMLWAQPPGKPLPSESNGQYKRLMEGCPR